MVIKKKDDFPLWEVHIKKINVIINNFKMPPLVVPWLVERLLQGKEAWLLTSTFHDCDRKEALDDVQTSLL